jgi:two-component sensor histidine kinase
MWLASLLVAYITVNTLVLRHLSRLSARMEEYRSGDTLPDFKLGPEAPAELREMADSYNELVTRVTRDQASLEDSLREQKLLLREVHHRVKNNLQLIASILNMQMRGVEDPAAKRTLGRVQDRVMSLSSIHRALYTDSRLDRVRVDHLLAEIVAGLEDVALPREAKYVGTPEGGDSDITVTLKERDGGEIVLAVRNTLEPDRSAALREGAEADGTGLGSKLIRAFASQLGGQVETEISAGAYDLTATFRADPEP